MKHPDKSRAFVNILAVVFLSLMAVVAASLISVTAMNLSAGDNSRRTLEARLAAESGLQFMLRQMRDLRLPAGTAEEACAEALQQVLAGQLDRTGNLPSGGVTVSGTVVFVPVVALPTGSFTCSLDTSTPERCLMTVTGSANGVTRRVAVVLDVVELPSSVFDYGLACKGPISISGSATVQGVNDPSEASVLSATTENNVAISLDGNATVEGDATVVQDPRYVVISGHPSLGGTSDASEMAEHIHALPEPPEFPAVDTAPLAALAVNVVDAATDTSGSIESFSNIRIAANTNPVFSSDVVLNGVIYVEAPNTVTFTAKATLNGIVVADGNGEDLEDCEIRFTGRVEAYGVDALPDTPEFSTVKEQTGTFVLAPGFQVTFTGNVSAVNGTIAADKLTFTGTAEGIVKGSVIGLTEQPMSVGGNVDILVDRSDATDTPAGFKKTLGFQPDTTSYTEPPAP